MNTKLFYLAGTQLILSLLLAILVTFISLKMLRYFLVRKYKIQLDNMAFAMLTAAVLFSVGYIVVGTLQPALNAIRILSQNTDNNWQIFISGVRYVSLFALIGFGISLLVIILGVNIFTFLTDNVKELEEISQNNQAVALITSVIIILIAMFVKDSTILLLESFVPYPQFYMK